jgi:hypothetical protein
LRVAKSGGSIALVRTSTLSLGVSRRTKLKNPVTAQLFIAGWNYCQQHGRALCLHNGRHFPGPGASEVGPAERAILKSSASTKFLMGVRAKGAKATQGNRGRRRLVGLVRDRNILEDVNKG